MNEQINTQNRLRRYVDNLFESAPQNVKTIELKEELLQNLTDKYNDLIKEGKTPEAAYNIAEAGVGDISGLIEQLENQSDGFGYTKYELEASRRKSAALTSIAVMLYILSIVPCIVIQSSTIAPTVMFMMIAAATGIIIYVNMTRLKPRGKAETVVENFKQWNNHNSNLGSAFKSISVALWSMTVVIYIVISFLSMAWYITWIIFLIAAAAEAILKAIFDLMK